MPIDSRNSNDHLSRDVILSKITEYDIFRYYCSPFKEVNVKFCSELRQDKTPTVSIIKWNGKLLYKDFGYQDHTFDCFSYIQSKYNVDFFDVLKIIDNDFSLNLSNQKDVIDFTKGYLGLRYNKPIQEKKVIIIKKRKRPWNMDDKNFWTKYGITKEILTIFDVEPIDYYWVNHNRFKCDPITYAYKIGSKYKIYAPYSDVKWSSNTTRAHIQGLKQMMNNGKIIILTSSLKDVMCLYSLGYNAVALQSEMQMPTEKFIEMLKEKFETLMILYDNDYDKESNPGQTMANKIIDAYNCINLVIPSHYKAKDISDFTKAYGIEEAHKLIKKLIYEKI